MLKLCYTSFMPQLAIRLLGSFQVTLDSQPVTGFAYDKVRALLAYLAVEADHFHRRETLATLFWPDHPPKLARQSLYRKKLSPCDLSDRNYEKKNSAFCRLNH